MHVDAPDAVEELVAPREKGIGNNEMYCDCYVDVIGDFFMF